MSAGDSTAASVQSEAMIALLLSQVEELRRDKDDLRADKEALKQENARLASELQRSLAGEDEASHSAQSTLLPEKRKLEIDAPIPPRKRGRPRKIKEDSAALLVEENPAPKKKGRPRKVRLGTPLQPSDDVSVDATRKRGRPRKNREPVQVALELDTGVQQLSTPAVKVDEAFVFTESDSEAILKNAPAFVIAPRPEYTVASREFYHSTYEGNPYQSVQFVKPHKNPSGNTQRMFLFPANDVNPSLPSIPGQSGFVIDNRYFRKSVAQPWSLFRKVSEGVKGLASTWLYLGEYEYTQAGKMSADVFNAQNELVQHKWATSEFLSSKGGLDESHSVIRARIALRKAGHITESSSKDAVDKLVGEELERIKAGNGSPVDADDIVAAFSRGDEAIDIAVLKCVSYDRVLAQDIASKFAIYSAPRRSPRSKAVGQANRSTRTPSTQQPGEASTSRAAVTNSPSSSRATRRLANMFTNPSMGTAGLAPEAWIPEVNSHRADGEAGEEGSVSYASEDEVEGLSYP